MANVSFSIHFVHINSIDKTIVSHIVKQTYGCHVHECEFAVTVATVVLRCGSRTIVVKNKAQSTISK